MIILQTKNPEFLKHSPSVILMCNSSVSFNYVLDMSRYKLKNINPPECMGVKNFKKRRALKILLYNSKIKSFIAGDINDYILPEKR